MVYHVHECRLGVGQVELNKEYKPVKNGDVVNGTRRRGKGLPFVDFRRDCGGGIDPVIKELFEVPLFLDSFGQSSSPSSGP